jgi:ribonuclease E
MSMRMLIDARHREETRVAVVKGNRIEEFDFESEEHKQLKGNIYLAKVTRVEPSLQAAFVDYGGNRHGFLAFSEIHPDYYQIPKEDREALLREEAEHAAEEEALRARDDEDEDEDEEIEANERLDDDGGRELLGAAEDHVHHDDEDGDAAAAADFGRR